MRDIRADLRERHAAVMGRIVDETHRVITARAKLESDHEQEIEQLERERKALEALLQIEQGRDGEQSPEQTSAKPILPLAEFLTTKVHAHGPMDKDELRSEADVAGYFNDAVNGRSFHTSLMNAVKHGKLIQTPDGKYAYPVRVSASLFDGGAGFGVRN